MHRPLCVLCVLCRLIIRSDDACLASPQNGARAQSEFLRVSGPSLSARPVSRHGSGHTNLPKQAHSRVHGSLNVHKISHFIATSVELRRCFPDSGRQRWRERGPSHCARPVPAVGKPPANRILMILESQNRKIGVPRACQPRCG
jgi:hypothetical protein